MQIGLVNIINNVFKVERRVVVAPILMSSIMARKFSFFVCFIISFNAWRKKFNFTINYFWQQNLIKNKLTETPSDGFGAEVRYLPWLKWLRGIVFSLAILLLRRNIDN